jgi:hypothetical protein
LLLDDWFVFATWFTLRKINSTNLSQREKCLYITREKVYLILSKQTSHTRTSFSMPYLGIVACFDEQALQNICPHALQWCRRRRAVNSARHLKQFEHSESSFHAGASSTSNMASASFNTGYWKPSNFIALK